MTIDNLTLAEDQSQAIERNKNRVKAFGLACIAIGDAIKEFGSIPSGQLYAFIMNDVTLDAYNSVISTLKNAGVISEDSQHVLKYEGGK